MRNSWQQKWIRLDPIHPDIQIAADHFQQFLFAWFRFEPKVGRCIIHGHCGAGKTTLARNGYEWCRGVNMRRYLKRPGPGPSSVPGPRFLLWQRAMNELATEQTFTYLDELSGASILFLDDVGAECDRFKNNLPSDVLAYLLNVCQDKTWLCITTNLSPDEWTKKWGERVADRLLRNATLVNLQNVPSYARK